MVAHQSISLYPNVVKEIKETTERLKRRHPEREREITYSVVVRAAFRAFKKRGYVLS